MVEGLCLYMYGTAIYCRLGNFSIEIFSPVAVVAKIKRAKNFLCISIFCCVVKIKRANISSTKKMYVKISRSTVHVCTPVRDHVLYYRAALL